MRDRIGKGNGDNKHSISSSLYFLYVVLFIIDDVKGFSNIPLKCLIIGWYGIAEQQ